MKDSNLLNIAIIGPPGSGKGTQAKLLLKEFKNLYYIYPGEIFRKLAKTGTDTGDKIKQIADKGGLQSEELAITLWMHEISFNLKKDKEFLLDGSPRKLNEAKVLCNFLKFIERFHKTIFLLIKISEKETYKRLAKRHDPETGKPISRNDDDVEDIKRRLHVYKKETIPAMKYLEKNCKLIEIEGEQSIKDVFEDILKVVKKK